MKLQLFVLINLLFLGACQSSNEEVEQTIDRTDQTVSDTVDYLSLGKILAFQTRDELTKQLSEALQSGGIENALAFCNIHALSLTDSMSTVLQANIKRVTDRPRNAENKANSSELRFIQQLKTNLSKGEKPKPIVQDIGEKKVGYYPIVLAGQCLKCHGDIQSDLTPGTANAIQRLYPYDQATGYAENEIRGLFVVEMNKK